MSDKNWVLVYNAEGKLVADMIRLLLESFGIPVVLHQESAGATYGFTVGPMGSVDVLVPPEKSDEARELLKAMDAGQLEVPDHENNKNNEDLYKPDHGKIV